MSEQTFKNLVLAAMVFAVAMLASAHAMQPVLHAMAGVLAAAFAITAVWLARGKLSESPAPEHAAILGAMQPDPRDMEA